MDEAGVFQCLGHSNWTICTPLSPSCSGNFQFVSLSYWEANSYYPRGLILREGSFSNSKTEWDRGISVLGAFKLDHLHPFKPILFLQFTISLSFILGGQFLLSQRANCEKGGKVQLQMWIRQRVLSAWGLQTGPFESLYAHFILANLIFFHLYTERPILITPEGY